VFVGVAQLLSAVFYSLGDALGSDRIALISCNDWHQISDIMTETYVCLLLIHLMGLRHEDTMMFLRYTAFAGCWVAKLADGWGSMIYEAVLLMAFSVPVFLLLLQAFITGPLLPLLPFDIPLRVRNFLERKISYDAAMAPHAAGSVVFGVIFLGLELTVDTDLRIFNALAHCAFGAAAYCLWRFLPCFDKSDELPGFR
jgi:hypothetical protein